MISPNSPIEQNRRRLIIFACATKEKKGELHDMEIHIRKRALSVMPVPKNFNGHLNNSTD
jgi:hypothetical protein